MLVFCLASIFFEQIAGLEGKEPERLAFFAQSAPPALVLPASTSILAAAHCLRDRPAALWNEPIAISCDRSYRLLDSHELLLAETQLQAQNNQALRAWCQYLEATNERLQHLAQVDELTQIANRRRFDLHFAQEWRQASRSQSWLSVIACDIDFFKAYNDTYGHPTGDLCLQRIAQAIAQSAYSTGRFSGPLWG
ncbi:MAG: diguanylate cyclase [Chloroflexaceae bacterium]|nr:diguanylate cyclase [Chloroflexaceae bacterium]